MNKSKAQAAALRAAIAQGYDVEDVAPVMPTARETMHGIAQSVLMLCASLASAFVIVSALVA